MMRYAVMIVMLSLVSASARTIEVRSSPPIGQDHADNALPIRPTCALLLQKKLAC
jgi:hypothetical protein